MAAKKDNTVLPRGENYLADEKQQRKDKEEKTPEGEVANRTILSRVRAGKLFMNNFSDVDKAACERWRDAAGSDIYTDVERYIDEDENVLDQQAVGITNEFQRNVLTLKAAVCINDPDFHVVSLAPNGTELVRADMRTQWDNKNWARKAAAVFQKRCIGGFGILAYRWDKKRRTVFELVHSWDLFADPCVTDWSELAWGGRSIRMSLREAIGRFDPGEKEGYFQEKVQQLDEEDVTASKDRFRVQITLYWDEKTEAVLYNNKVIHREKNRYGEVPLLFLEGDVDPGPTSFPLGLGVLCAGPQQQVTDLDGMITNTAKNGVPFNVISEKVLTNEVRQAITDGKTQQFIPIKAVNITSAIQHYPAEEVSETTLTARSLASKVMHAIMGTNELMMGQHIEGVSKATEIHQLTQQQGARIVQLTKEYERFVNMMAWVVVHNEAEFGGARMSGGRVKVTEEERATWLAYKGVKVIYVVESSTVYRNPQQDQQQSMQLLELAVRQAQMLIGLGVPQPMVCLGILHMIEDVLKAFGRTNTDEYFPGLQQLKMILAQSYMQMLQQGQLPPPPGHDQMKPASVSVQYKDLPQEAQQTLLLKWGLIQPGQQVTPVSPADGEGGGNQNVLPELIGAQLKAENAEKDRIADMVKQEAEHRHLARMQEHRFSHEREMAHVGAMHRMITAPPPAKNGKGEK
jgi:hypothetical protein